MIRVFEAFAGVGSQRMALRNLGIDHEVVAIAEIDKHAIASYEAIHGKVNNLGDISKIDTNDIPDHDLFTYSFPCQDISVAGKGLGLDEGSDTRSGLLWECQKVISIKKPKYLLLENVKNLVGKNHLHNFNKWLDWLEVQGYSSYWQVLNAKDYGIPQNRERVFVVSVLREYDNWYQFPLKMELETKLKDLLEENVDEKYYLSKEQVDRILTTTYMTNKRRIQEKDWCDTLCARDYKDPKCVTVADFRYDEGLRIRKEMISPCLTTKDVSTSLSGNPLLINMKLKIKNATKQGYIEAEDGDCVDISYPDSETRRGRVQKGVSHTLTTIDDKCVVLDDLRIRKLTPKEYWRLMGFSDEDFEKAAQVNSNSQMYKQAGNSIVVNVLEEIFR